MLGVFEIVVATDVVINVVIVAVVVVVVIAVFSINQTRLSPY